MYTELQQTVFRLIQERNYLMEEKEKNKEEIEKCNKKIDYYRWIINNSLFMTSVHSQSISSYRNINSIEKRKSLLDLLSIPMPRPSYTAKKIPQLKKEVKQLQTRRERSQQNLNICQKRKQSLEKRNQVIDSRLDQIETDLQAVDELPLTLQSQETQSQSSTELVKKMVFKKEESK